MTFRPPSVTTVLGKTLDKSGPLCGWTANQVLLVCKGAILPGVAYDEIYLEEVWRRAKRSYRDVKQEAADIGTEVHRRLEAIFRAGDAQSEISSATSRPEVENCVRAGCDWLQQHSVKRVCVERRIFSRKYKYTGTLDKLAYVDGVLSLIDWKSSNGIYEDYLLQTSAYQGAYEEETSARIERRILVRLGKFDGAFEVHEFNTRKLFKQHYSTFLAALKLYKGLKEMA